jgi:NAD(P)-dependent dehydrogenase (short-subunit alcohol dehydrogenase family)
MTGRVAGKVAIVTGGAAGIGAATARLLAAEGASVLVAGRSLEKAQAVVDEIGEKGGDARAHLVDLGHMDQVEAMVEAAVETFGALHILHNNASERSNVATDNRVVETDLAIWQRQLDVDLTAPMWASRCAIPHMIAAGGGSIIHTSSLAARMAQNSRTAYGSAKAGLLGLSKAIAVQYGKDGIRSNVVLPGPILSPTVRKLFDEDELRVWEDHVMAPELGVPEDVASAVLFLAADESRYITAQELTVDGGISSYIAPVPAFRARTRGSAGADPV